MGADQNLPKTASDDTVGSLNEKIAQLIKNSSPDEIQQVLSSGGSILHPMHNINQNNRTPTEIK